VDITTGPVAPDEVTTSHRARLRASFAFAIDSR
jgi:hypothetical protein